MKRMIQTSMAAMLLATTAFSAHAKQGAYEMVVLHVEGTALKRGAVIDGNQTLTLKSGAKVTLVGADGKTVTVQGPSSGKPAGRGSNGAKSSGKVAAILGALLSNEERSTRALGVVRSASATGSETLPDAWAVNVGQSGTKCVTADVVKLWRPDATGAAKLQIRKAQSAHSAKADWPAGQAFLPINAKTFQSGQNYIISVNGRSSEMKFNVMPAGLNNPTEQAAWMARHNCRDQALAMVDGIR
ncbi:MAG: hypothetical protein ACI9JL_000474 [Paracoccaceae bacterium]|jgi:hypothetical protein